MERQLLTGTCFVEGVAFFPLRVIEDERGAVLHMLREDSSSFTRFGEIYFSEVKPGAIKAWKRHFRMTQRLAVPFGRVKFVIYDDRPTSATKGAVTQVIAGRPDAYGLLIIPPLLWYGFQGLGSTSALLANCADFTHDPQEVERRPYDTNEIAYAW